MKRQPLPPGQRREPRITASHQRRKLLALLVANGLGQAACATDSPRSDPRRFVPCHERWSYA